MREKHLADSQIERFDSQQEEIDLLMLASYFLEHIKMIISFFFAGALIFGLVSMFLIKPTYESTAKLYIISASNNSVVDLTDLDIGTSLTADYEELIISEPVAEQVIENLHLSDTPEELLKKITITNPADTRVLYITAATHSATMSADLANEFMDVSLKYLPDTMSTNPPNVAQRAKVPELKASPSNSKNTLMGALLGLILACGILTVRYLKDDTIKTPEEFEDYFGILPIASIPNSEEIEDPSERGSNGKKSKKKRKSGKKRGGKR